MQSIEDRLRQLERSNKRLHKLLASTLIGITAINAAVIGGCSREAQNQAKTATYDVVKATTFEVVDAEGRRYATFGATTISNEPAIGLVIGEGDRSTLLTMSDKETMLRIVRPDTNKGFGVGIGRDGAATAFLVDGKKVLWSAP